MESEQETRRRLEIEKRSLIDEIEKLHADILDRPDVGQVQRDVARAREEEVSKLNRQLEQVYQSHENQISELRQKHAKQFDEHLVELETSKRQLHTLAKEYQALLDNFNDRNSEIKSFSVYKQEAERKRRQLETSYQELQQKLNENERAKSDIVENLRRFQADSESIHGSYGELERSIQNYERTIVTLKSENEELKEHLQDENRQKVSCMAKLRQVEELSNELKEQLDEREEELSRMNEKSLKLTEQNKKVVRDAEQVYIEQNDDLRRKFQTEKDDLLQQLDQEKASHSKLAKINQKYLNDINDLSVELERYRGTAQSVTRDKRTFERKIQEEKVTQETLRTERDQLERELREKDTQRLNVIKELNEVKYEYENLERRYSELQIDKSSINSNDVVARMNELNTIKRKLGKTISRRTRFDMLVVCFSRDHCSRAEQTDHWIGRRIANLGRCSSSVGSEYHCAETTSRRHSTWHRSGWRWSTRLDQQSQQSLRSRTRRNRTIETTAHAAAWETRSWSSESSSTIRRSASREGASTSRQPSITSNSPWLLSRLLQETACLFRYKFVMSRARVKTSKRNTSL